MKTATDTFNFSKWQLADIRLSLRFIDLMQSNSSSSSAAFAGLTPATSPAPALYSLCYSYCFSFITHLGSLENYWDLLQKFISCEIIQKMPQSAGLAVLGYAWRAVAWLGLHCLGLTWPLPKVAPGYRVDYLPGSSSSSSSSPACHLCLWNMRSIFYAAFFAYLPTANWQQ